jgi:hypothetical protein
MFVKIVQLPKYNEDENETLIDVYVPIKKRG